MRLSRRNFVLKAIPLVSMGGIIVNTSEGLAQGDIADEKDIETIYKLSPVGRIEKKEEFARIRIFDQYVDALLGLEGWSHVNVFYWFDKNDIPQKRRILQVHPRGNKDNPLTGVFACRAPVRPNLIALSVCKILSVEGNLVNLDKIDAFDSTPVLDLKPFIPPDEPKKDVRVPEWTKRNSKEKK